VMTPYVAGQPNPNPAGTVESQAVVPGKVSFSIKSKALKKKGWVTISGKVTADGKAVGKARIQVYRVPNLNKPVFAVYTKANGTFSLKRKFKRRTVLFAIVVKVTDLGAPPCPATPLPGVPGGCVSATSSFGAAAFFTARPRKR
jgi:hypothetical protein